MYVFCVSVFFYSKYSDNTDRCGIEILFCHRFEYVLCGVVAFLLHALLQEVNAQFQVEVLLLQRGDLLWTKANKHISTLLLRATPVVFVPNAIVSSLRRKVKLFTLAKICESHAQNNCRFVCVVQMNEALHHACM